MIKIEFNQDFCNNHCEQIKIKIEPFLLEERINNFDLEDNDKNCLRYISSNLENILKSDTNGLKTYIQYFKDNHLNSLGIPNQKKEDWHPLYKIIREEIFENEYNNWSNRKTYGAYVFVKELGLKTCPYCNRNYMFIVDEESGKLRPELDHFHPKSLYPFLAMSFYNLIPSCSTCNHTKKDKDSFKLNLINPYDINNENIKFTYTPSSIDFTNVESQKYNFENFDIEFTQTNSNIEIFKLDELYKQHKDIVLDLLIKKVYYPTSYIEELKSSFGFSEDEIYRFLLNNYKKEEDLHKRPLSKLIKDISEELDLI